MLLMRDLVHHSSRHNNDYLAQDFTFIKSINLTGNYSLEYMIVDADPQYYP